MGENFAANIKVASGYYISSYSVKVGSSELKSGTGYTYNITTGDLKINAAYITGNITVSISTPVVPSSVTLPSSSYKWTYYMGAGNVMTSNGHGNLHRPVDDYAAPSWVYYSTAAGNIYVYIKIGNGAFLKNYSTITFNGTGKVYDQAYGRDWVRFGIGTNPTAAPNVVATSTDILAKEYVTRNNVLTIPKSSLVDTTDYYIILETRNGVGGDGYIMWAVNSIKLTK